MRHSYVILFPYIVKISKYAEFDFEFGIFANFYYKGLYEQTNVTFK